MSDNFDSKKSKTKLNDEELELVSYYIDRMKKAESMAEMNYCYNQAKIIIKEAEERLGPSK